MPLPAPLADPVTRDESNQCICVGWKLRLSSDFLNICHPNHSTLMIMATRPADLRDRWFGRLLVIEFVDVRKGNAHWKCRCACGIEVIVSACHLRSGHTTSCGCYQRERAKAEGHRHGHATRGSTRTYRSWQLMKRRCDDPKSNRWEQYGGRGIHYCNRWRDFANFLTDMGERPAGKTLDRRDTNGHYCKENCKWSTPKEQAQNRRSSKKADSV